MSKTQAHIVADNYDTGRRVPTDAQLDRLMNDLTPSAPAVAEEQDGERWDGLN